VDGSLKVTGLQNESKEIYFKRFLFFNENVKMAKKVLKEMFTDISY